MIYAKGAVMNIFEAKEAKIKAYLKVLSKNGATSPKKAVKIEDVERALKIEDRLFDEITKYLIAEGLIKRAAGAVHLTKLGAGK
jgi:Mn-dependent DtxR family transcriptional regulator